MTGGVREIRLTQGRTALVDSADFEWLSQWKWYAHGRPIYACRQTGTMGHANRQAVKMHRVVAWALAGEIVDHINGDPLDNRGCNLRICTAKENSRNKPGRSDKFKGVFPARHPVGYFDARIGCDYKHRYLGSYPTAGEAARAYDAAAIRLHGEFARLNFEDSRSLAEPERRSHLARGERSGRAKMTAESVLEIRRRHAAGESMYRLGLTFGMSHQGIRSIIIGATWRHLLVAA